MEEKKEKRSFWSNKSVQNGICIVSFVLLVMTLAAAWMLLKTVENDYYLRYSVIKIATEALRTPRYADFPEVQTYYPVSFYDTYRLLRYGGFVFLAVTGIIMILFAVSLIRRSVLELRPKDTPVRRKTDRLFTLCLAAGAAASVWFAAFVCRRYAQEALREWQRAYNDGVWARIFGNALIGLSLILLCAVLCIVPVLYFFMEFLRRISERTVWNKSMLRSFWKLIRALIKRLGSDKETWLFCYMLLLLVNLSVALMHAGIGKRVCIVLVEVLNLLCGIAVYIYLKEQDMIREKMKKNTEGDFSTALEPEKLHGMNRRTAQLVRDMELSTSRAIEQSVKDERLRTELITNVSHDIRTPLTSIINYVDLLKQEPTESENARKYLNVLEEKAARLKTLTDDLMEASKITSGNISIVPVKLNIRELAQQIAAEYEDAFAERGLTLIMNLPQREEDGYFEGDSRHVWRVFSNLLGNVCKYAMPNTRVYLDAVKSPTGMLCVHLKNVSEYALNISPEELTERFVRGDESRGTTQGNGLGLSIAKSLMSAMHGRLTLFIDGDLFKVILAFPND